jgi:aspartate racemase
VSTIPSSTNGPTNAASQRHIGVVGVSPEGAAVFYTQLFHHASRKLTPHQQPRVTVHTEPLAGYLDAIRKNDWHTVGRLLRRSADLLARCGAEFCVTPDNIVQHASHLAEAGSPLPWLSMTDLVANAVVRDGRKTVGVIGTKMVTSSSIYQTPLGMRGVHVLPPQDSEADQLDQIIFGELLYGHIRPESRQAILQIIANLASRGCEAVILACSEAPLVVTSENSPIPVYDATDLLAEGAIRRAMPPG